MTTPPSGPLLGGFTEQLPFRLDAFQRTACEALENGHGVLVCAPTGAGKTVVGEFAVHLALAAGRKCFYTTPIKALSNQKHNDLVGRYGAEKIGLLTGDQSINGDADIVVMTTEVLRNMLYANSPALQGLSHVVMDEVHFLADRMRGAVWEEVILHLPDDVLLVSLSATVSNAEEFGGWIQTVRGDTTVVVDEHRPVPLWQHVMVGKRVFDLFDYRAKGATQASRRPGRELLVDPELLRHIAHRLEADRLADWQPRGRGRNRDRPSSYRGPSRPDVIGTLEREGLLPAITFIFSRVGCDAAVKQCLRSSLRLTTGAERARIAEIIDRRCADLPEADLIILDYHEWREGLLRGLAAHHAGMLPVFRHTVEELFVAGLVKAVFATETLALGINMPARTVVLERLVKFNGEQHMPLTPGEYTQLTGRAGRRGIDVEGHAVVLWTPNDSTVDPAEVAGLASTRTFPLRSSFAPSYNMTINLVHQMGPAQAHKLLESSFAQYQADRSVVGLVRGIERGEQMLAEIADDFGGKDAPDPGVRAVARNRYPNVSGPSREPHGCSAARPPTMRSRRLRRGDIITITHGRRGGLAVVLEAARDSDDPRPLVLDRTPLGGPDFVGGLLGCIGAAWDRCPCPNASNTETRARVATWPRRCGRRRADSTSRRRSARAAESPWNVTSTPNWRRCVSKCGGIPHTKSPIARTRRDLPSAICESSATTSRPGRRSPRPRIRWRERSTESSCCSPNAASSTRGRPTATRRSPTTVACWRGSTARAICWSPNLCAAAHGRAWSLRSWQRCCRRCSTSPAATRRPPLEVSTSRPATCDVR